ncbi:hypothetical protein JG688_00016410, partial [Phytophthora aleatoria]
HLTTRAEAASYLTTKTLLIDDQDREDVKTLADARASSKQITNFLNERIGEESEFESAEECLKNMLHALVQIESSNVLVIQDEMDVTCGIVVQTKLQKLMLERWGETLAMDFTHGTNNLGYHLGT